MTTWENHRTSSYLRLDHLTASNLFVFSIHYLRMPSSASNTRALRVPITKPSSGLRIESLSRKQVLHPSSRQRRCDEESGAGHRAVLVLAAVVVTLGLVGSLPTYAQTLDEAIAVLRALAEQGDATAQFTLGRMYDTGRVVPQDDAEAVRWYRLAAEQSDAGAQHSLGSLYANGEGVPQDEAEAERWLRLAAEQGGGDGQQIRQFYLGRRYDTGRGVPQDDAEAVVWYRKAAEHGYPYAQYALGLMYANGEGVPQDDAEAVRWYRLAGGQDLDVWFLYLVVSRDEIGDVEAERWYRLAAEQGNASAQNALGGLYANGEGVPQDEAEAVRWYRLAAEQGYAGAQFNLGLSYGQGRGVPQDDVTAHMWLNLAASRLTGEQREDAAKARDAVAARMTPEGRSEAQRLAREWDAAHPR